MAHIVCTLYLVLTCSLTSNVQESMMRICEIDEGGQVFGLGRQDEPANLSLGAPRDDPLSSSVK